MGPHPPGERPRLTLAPEADAGVVGVSDLVGLDLTRVPQELAGHVPSRGAPWPRGTCLPPVATPEGRQTLCFGTMGDLRPLAAQWRGGVAVNSARTLWVVTLRD